MGLFGLHKKKRAASSGCDKTVSPPERLLSYQFANVQGIGTRNRQEDSFSQMNVLDVKKIIGQ